MLRVFPKFCKFLFISKIIFQSLPVDVSITLNHVNYYACFLFIYLSPHLYFSKSPSYHNISNCSTRASAIIGIRAESSCLGHTTLFTYTNYSRIRYFSRIQYCSLIRWKQPFILGRQSIISSVYFCMSRKVMPTRR